MAGSSWGVQTWCDLLYNPDGLSSHWNEVLLPSASERFISFPLRVSLKQRCQFWKQRFTMLGDDLRSGFCKPVSSFWSVISKQSVLKWHIPVYREDENKTRSTRASLFPDQTVSVGLMLALLRHLDWAQSHRYQTVILYHPATSSFVNHKTQIEVSNIGGYTKIIQNWV